MPQGSISGPTVFNLFVNDRLKIYLAGFKACRTLSESPTFHLPFIFLNHAKHLTHSAPINVWPNWPIACLYHPQYHIVPVALYNQTLCQTSQSCHLFPVVFLSCPCIVYVFVQWCLQFINSSCYVFVCPCSCPVMSQTFHEYTKDFIWSCKVRCLNETTVQGKQVNFHIWKGLIVVPGI